MIYIFIIIIIVVFLVCYFLKTKESFQILGAAGPYVKQYTRCLGECERQNRAFRLSSNNFRCGLDCSRQVSQAVNGERRPNIIYSSQDMCETVCGEDDVKCLDACVSKFEVKRYCGQLCRLSPQPDCLEQCYLVTIPNANGRSWIYRR